MILLSFKSIGCLIPLLTSNCLNENMCNVYARGANTPGKKIKGNSATNVFAGSFIK